jgi:hypothetical protein
MAYSRSSRRSNRRRSSFRTRRISKNRRRTRRMANVRLVSRGGIRF